MLFLVWRFNAEGKLHILFVDLMTQASHQHTLLEECYETYLLFRCGVHIFTLL
jgi:hypothetical protein